MILHDIPKEVTHPILPDWMIDGIRSWQAQSGKNYDIKISKRTMTAQVKEKSSTYWMLWPEQSIRSWTMEQYWMDGPINWDNVEMIDD